MIEPCDVLTLGESMAVLYPPQAIGLEAAARVELDVAGAEGNLAIALARLGLRARLVARVGDDPFGRRLRATYAAEGVLTDGLLTDTAAATGVFFREWLADGARRVYYYRRGSAGARLAATDLRPEWFANARALHLTGITPALSVSCAATCAAAIDMARAHGLLVSFDPNYRAPLWDVATARATLLPLMARCDVLLVGDEEGRMVFETADDDATLAAAAALGPRVVVLKRGAQGAWGVADGVRAEVAAVPVVAVDPVGAGDGFDAGFLAAWLRGDGLAAALRLGARIGAAAVAQMGDYAGYPRLRVW